jgi:transposase
MAYDIPTRFHKVWSRHFREIERTKLCGRIRIIVKKKRRIAIHHPTTVGVM